MDNEEILYEVSDFVATITLHRPDKLNAWTFRMEKEYRAALANAESRDDVRVVVVTGSGRGFCAGADLSLLASIEDGTAGDAARSAAEVVPGSDEAPDDFRKTYAFPLAVRKPIIAAVNGHAIGLGLVHALYSDIRFASDRAKFSTAFSRIGLPAEHGIGWILPRLVGPEHALDLLLSARTIDADEALRIGLVSRVLPHEELVPAVREYATRLATECSPRALSIIKRQVWESLLTRLGPAIDFAVEAMHGSFDSPDFAEGVRALLEKRPARFSGE